MVGLLLSSESGVIGHDMSVYEYMMNAWLGYRGCVEEWKEACIARGLMPRRYDE